MNALMYYLTAHEILSTTLPANKLVYNQVLPNYNTLYKKNTPLIKTAV